MSTSRLPQVRSARRGRRSVPTRIAAALLCAGLLGGLVGGVAQARGAGVATYSQYDDDIAQANSDKAAKDRAISELEHALEDTDAAIVRAKRELDELNAQLVVVKQELKLAEERLDAALLQQQIVADKLAAAEAEDQALTKQIHADEGKVDELRDVLAEIARSQYEGASQNDSLSIIFGASTTQEFVDDFAFRQASSRVQSTALAQMQELAAVNRNRGARQEAVRDYIQTLKDIADQLVIEAETARQLAADKKAEVEKLQAEAEAKKQYLESQRASFLAQQAVLEQQRRELLDELAVLVAKKKAEEAANGTGSLSRGYLSFPTAVPYITSPYGYRIHPIYGTRMLHAGTDFRAYCGTAIYAAADGKVEWAKYRYGLGNQVMLYHGIVGGKVLMSSYNHLSQFAVYSGQSVDRGQLVGYAGTTGSSTACHLHFEVYEDGQTVDPMTLLPYL